MDEVLDTPELAPDSTVPSVDSDGGGGLPSAQDDLKSIEDGFAITDEIKSKYFKNDKLFGRFDNIDGMAQALKSVEDKYSAVMRDIKSPKDDAVTAAPVAADNSNVQPLINEYVQSGFELTDDLIARAVEQGVDIRDVKIAAIEIKEKIGKAYEVVGGKDEYELMIQWGKDNLDEKSKISFDKELGAESGEWAIRGLYAQYKSSTSADGPSGRITGDSGGSGGNKAYANISEILRDKAYIDGRGKNDTKAINMYKSRMAATPDHVVYKR